ncbi:MAG: MlaD family protein [Hyphomicrobiales bacterium]|nr:MlaD family protein [Hyphomicrobiales bacterium]
METRANHLVIGLFVVGVIGACLSFVYWMRSYGGGDGGQRYHVLFEGSVQGLAEASTVLFNGLRVGAVESLEIVPEDTRKVRALIVVKPSAPVRETSRARISQQGLAGLVALEITPGAPDSPLLTAKQGEPFPVIVADKSGAGSLLSGVPDAVGSAQALLARMNDVVAENQASIRATIKNVESLTAMLEGNKEAISEIILNTRDVTQRFGTLSAKLEKTVDSLSAALVNDPKSFVVQAQQAAQSVRQLADKLDKSFGDQADGLSRSAQRSLREFELFMKEARRLAEDLDRVVQRVEKNPSGFLFGGVQTPQYTPGQ